jgi:hypothetical protein
MSESRRLSDKILSSLERHQRELAEQQKLIDETMNELLEQRERFAAVARRIMESVIHPRMEEMMADYVAGSQPGSLNMSQYQTMHTIARQMAGLMAGQATLLMNNGRSVDVNRYRRMMGTINSNMPYITDNAVNGIGMDSSFMTSMRNQMDATIRNMPIGGGFMNYSGMFRNMTSHNAFWNYTGNRWQPGTMMGNGGMMRKLH